MKIGAPRPDRLTGDELTALEPGVPDRLERRPDVLVVGGRDVGGGDVGGGDVGGGDVGGGDVGVATR